MMRVAWWFWLLVVGTFCAAFAASVERPHIAPSVVWFCVGSICTGLVVWGMTPRERWLQEELAASRESLNVEAISAGLDAEQWRKEAATLRVEAARLTAENKVLVTELALARSGAWRVGPGGAS